MKKNLVIISALIVALVLLLFSVPFFFQNKIEKAALRKINATTDAIVTYDQFSLSLLKSFPNFTATFKGLKIIGKEPFVDDTLANLKELSATLSLKSVFSGKSISVRSVCLIDGKVNALYNENGLSIWKNTPFHPSLLTGEVAKKNGKKKNKTIEFNLEKVEFQSFSFCYSNEAKKIHIEADSLSGNVVNHGAGKSALFDVAMRASAIFLEQGGTKYVDKPKFELKTAFDADLEKWGFSFVPNKTSVNGVTWAINGGFAMPGDTVAFDMKFDVPGLTLKNLLGVLPANIQSKLLGYKTEGNLCFQGSVKGNYTGKTYPAINVEAEVKNGKMQYPGLPESIEINDALLQISMPEGPIDALELNVNNVNCTVAGNAISTHIDVLNLFGDQLIDAGLNGKIDLASLPKALPLDNFNMKGIATANVEMKGLYSDLKQDRFDLFHSAGNIDIVGLYIKNETIPQGVSIDHAAVILKNETVEVKGVNGSVGSSDFALTGSLANPLKWFFVNGTLTGKFQLNSKHFNVNEFFRRDTSKQKLAQNENKTSPADSAKKEEPFVFPKNTDLTFFSKITQVVYDQMDIRNFEGTLMLKNQALVLRGLRMEMLKGELSMQGSIIADGRPLPEVDLNLEIHHFNLPTAASQLSVVRKYLPIAKESEGSFSSNLTLKTKLDSNLKMEIDGLTAIGDFSTHNMKLVKPESVSHLKSAIQTDKLDDITIKDFTAQFSIADNKLKLDPFKTEVAGQPTNIGGTYNMAGTLDFRIDALVDKDLLSTRIQDIISYIPGNQKLKKVDIGLEITGDAKKPTVKVDEEKIKKQVVDQIKNSSVEDLQDAAKKLFKKFLK